MRIALLCGHFSTDLHGGKLDASSLFESRALTGSESSFFNVGKGLAEIGHTVHIYCPVIAPVPSHKELAGADVLDIDEFDSSNYDAHIALNEPDLLRRANPSKLRVLQQQLNDFRYCEDNFDEYTDIYAFLSPVHAQHVSNKAKLPPAKVTWVPNSINLEMFQFEERRVPHTMAWCSSPDRGLHRILEIMLDIRKRVPDAKLDIYYRFDPWYEQNKDKDSKAGARARHINECLVRLGRRGENGVTLVGPVPNKEMARALLRTEVLPYTCDPYVFTEGFSVAIMDACAAGCVPIISNADAIGDIYQNVAYVIPGRPHERRSEWVDAIVRAMTDPGFRDGITRRAKAFAERFHRTNVARLWEILLRDNLPHKHSKGLSYNLPANIQAYAIPTGPSDDAILYTDNDPTNWKAGPPITTPSEWVATTSALHPNPPAHPIVPTKSILHIDLVMNENCVGLRAGTSRAFNPHALLYDKRGLSGTDINFFGSALALARRGHTVRIFTILTQEANIGGVQFLQYARFHTTNPADVSIAHYDMASLVPSKARLNIAVQHTILPPSEESYKKFTDNGTVHVNLSPSKHNMEHLRRAYAPTMPWYVLPNANDLGTFHPHVPVPGRMIYHTSPERGLHKLLGVLPRIREKVPSAHIRFIGDLDHLDWYDQIGGRHKEIASEIKTLLKQEAAHISLLSRSSRQVILQELSQAAVYAYPSDPPIPCEVAPVSIMDCLRTGLPVVMIPSDGIEKLFNQCAVIASNLDEFVEHTIEILKGTSAHDHKIAEGKSLMSTYSFDDQALHLEKIILRELDHTVIIPDPLSAPVLVPATAALPEIPQLPSYSGQ